MAIHQVRHLYDFRRINALEHFIKTNVQNKIIADCGSGSGIITWLALKYGAKKVYCIEKDTHALLHLNDFLYGNNNKVEICKIDYTTEQLPHADIYIHDMSETYFFTKEFYYFLKNCKKQNIQNVYPNKVKFFQGLIDKEYEYESANARKNTDLETESTTFFNLMHKIYPGFAYSKKNIFNSKITLKDVSCILDTDIFELLDLSIPFENREHIWWEASFDNEFTISSINNQHNRCNIGMQKTKLFKSNLRSLLKSQP